LTESGEVAPDDAALVRAFLRGREEEVFRALFRRHTPALFRLAVRLLGGDEAGAEDVVQEAWIRAVQKLPAYRFEAALRTWLCGFIVNCARETVRRRSAARRASPDPAVEPEAPGEVDPALALDLERAVQGLAEGYRAIFVLHDLMGFTHREIAEGMGIEEGTSKSQLFLARRALRRRLATGSEVGDG
jgi:RNA polymerase sigma-70 factor (ECF subfamily)